MSLLRTTRGGKQVDFAIANGGVLLGTAPGCQIVVADPAAAPKHCRVAQSPEGVVVTDLSGTGGTIVNGSKVKQQVLKNGDVLQVGSEKFVYTEKQEPVAAGVKSGDAAPAAAAAGGRRPLPSRAPRGAAPKPAAPAKTNGGAKPGTGTGAVRKLTAKPGSVARVHKDHHMFALPSTTKGRTIAIAVAVGLVVLGGALFAISMNTVNSEQVKEQAQADIDRLLKMPETDYEQRLALIEEILANENYKKYAGGVIAPAFRARNKVKEQVDLEKGAAQPSKRFIDKYKSLKEGNPEEFKRAQEGLYDEVNVLLGNYEGTRLAAELRKIREELKTAIENVGPSWNEEIVKLSREVTRQITARNFNQGMVEVDTFGSRYGEKDSPQLKARLKVERDRLKDEAERHVVTLIKESATKATKEERRKFLEAARPFINSFPDALKALDKAISENK